MNNHTLISSRARVRISRSFDRSIARSPPFLKKHRATTLDERIGKKCRRGKEREGKKEKKKIDTNSTLSPRLFAFFFPRSISKSRSFFTSFRFVWVKEGEKEERKARERERECFDNETDHCRSSDLSSFLLINTITSFFLHGRCSLSRIWACDGSSHRSRASPVRNRSNPNTTSHRRLIARPASPQSHERDRDSLLPRDK